MNRKAALIPIGIIGLLVVATAAIGQHERERKLAADRKVAVENGWIYDDLEKGRKVAKETGKPLLVVVRCPP